MYRKSADKSGTIQYMYEWPLHKELLLVPKLITVREGIPLLMTSQGCPYDITSEGNPHNNKLKHQSELIHACKECRQKWHNLIHV